jgi:uncharacterized membrane-anchored protein
MFKFRLAGMAFAGVLVCGAFAGAALAGDAQASDPAESQRLEGVLRSQHPQWGDVSVPTANATLHLGKRYYFLKADEAKQVLTEWGNPPASAEGVLGLVFPAGTTFLDRGWAGVITYEQAGYVNDEDADQADYQKLLDEMHKGEDAENAERKRSGFHSVHLVGWAQPPSYDKARHQMIWAQDLQFGGVDHHTLNYDVRVLGRRGYLSVNVVTSMDQLAEVRPAAAQLASAVSFDPGSTYADYDPGHDKKAEYGMMGLVAAGLGLAAAKKLGLLAAILVFAKKGVVLILAAGAAVVARVKRLFKKEPSAPA